MNWRESCLLGAVFAVLTALGLFIFPGHAFLLSDTQIYLPLFSHLENSQLLPNELILTGAHLSYTIYDEVTLGLTRLFSINFEQALFSQQFLFRWIGYWGAFWLARASGLPIPAAVLTSAILWLGAFVYGPAVITTEFEPVPRGFAVSLLVAALGAASQHYRNLASLLLATAFLYHAPAVWPVLALAIVLKRWRPLAYTAAAAFLLVILAKNQSGVIEAQPFFSFIDPQQRVIQQLRAPYNWISLWPARHWLQFLLTGGLAIAAYYRLRNHLPEFLKPYFLYLPIIGLATMPLSWLLLEKLGWALLPQIQPMRAVLFCHLLCQWLGAIAAWHDLNEGKWLRAAGWLIVPLSLSLRGDLLQVPPAAIQNQLILLALIVGACWIAWRFPRREYAWATSLLAALIYGEAFHARAHAPVETPALTELSTWAAQRTSLDAMFLFPDLGRRIEPGIFRARASRAVYVCWKQGGQVNYFPKYAEIWWERWSKLLAPNHPALDYADLRRRGITHLVFTKEAPAEDLQPLYVSPTYRVYTLSP